MMYFKQGCFPVFQFHQFSLHTNPIGEIWFKRCVGESNKTDHIANKLKEELTK